MENCAGEMETVKYASNGAWWTPTLLLLLLLPKQIHTNHFWWWSLVDAGLLLLLLSILYAFTHPILSFSQFEITQRRGPFRVTIDLNNLESVRVNTTGRRTAVMDPQTGERRSVIRFYVKYPDDWAGKPPVQSVYVRDRKGHHLDLSVQRTKVDHWGACLLRAIRAQSEVELGPRVVEALESFTR